MSERRYEVRPRGTSYLVVDTWSNGRVIGSASTRHLADMMASAFSRDDPLRARWLGWHLEACCYYAAGAFFGAREFTSWHDALLIGIGMGVCVGAVLAATSGIVTLWRRWSSRPPAEEQA